MLLFIVNLRMLLYNCKINWEQRINLQDVFSVLNCYWFNHENSTQTHQLNKSCNCCIRILSRFIIIIISICSIIYNNLHILRDCHYYWWYSNPASFTLFYWISLNLIVNRFLIINMNFFILFILLQFSSRKVKKIILFFKKHLPGSSLFQPPLLLYIQKKILLIFNLQCENSRT